VIDEVPAIAPTLLGAVGVPIVTGLDGDDTDDFPALFVATTVNE
jgi:hypothetical protein